jgi:mannose-1-phosphate guanylyltransferase/mannose-6-phosphate isomerase
MDTVASQSFVQITERRPWGSFTILSDEDDHKVKRIVVKPGQRLSLQRHKLRREHWFVVSGRGLVTLDSEKISLASGCAVDIGTGVIHRVENREEQELVFIETQLGDYFGEDDIERLEDDYGRREER